MKALTRGRTDHFSNTFPPVTLNFKYNLDCIKKNQHANYIDQRSFRSNVIVRANTHTYTIDCSTWTSKAK